MELEFLDILNGSLSLIACVLACYVGVKIGLRYFEFKRREFLLMGITGVLLVAPWWPSATSFLMVLLSPAGEGLPPKAYFALGNVLIPVAITCWLIVFSDFLCEGKQKLIISISIIYGIVFEVMFFYLLYSDISRIGILASPVDAEYKQFIMVYLFSVIFIILATGIPFALESMKSENREVKLKGKMILAAFISFSVGAIMDAFLGLNPITLVIARLILMSSAVEFYGGFILPEWMKKIFLRD